MSAKAQVHKHSAQVNFTSSTLKNQAPTEKEVRWDLQQPLKEEMAWSWRSPDRGSSSWESQVTHPQHVLGAPPCLLPQPPRGAHAFSSSCSWSNLLFCQHKLPNFYLQGCLQPGLQVHWWKQTHFSFYAQMPPCHLSAWDSHGSILLTLHCHRLGLSPDFCLSPPLQQNTTRNPGECQVNTLSIIHRFAIIRELCSSKLFIKGMPLR